ncbi:MAG: hypothetical protein M0Z49_03990 [Chloroflexi bacterium]|nr:hypothetical protein [Chloroflexota bacterium]
MAALMVPVDGEVVWLEVPRHLTTVARTIILETSFHRRTGVRIRWPDKWARAVVDRVLRDHGDPVVWAARQAELARRTAIARRMAPEGGEIPVLQLVDRLMNGRLEDGTRLDGREAEALQHTAQRVVGHGRHASCPTCRLLEAGDVRAYLRATGCDPILLRILHAEAQQAELLPAYPVRPEPKDWFTENLTEDELAELMREDDAA